MEYMTTINQIENNRYSLLRTLLLGISLIIASSIMGNYIVKARQTNRYVNVKGLAEREVIANIGIWPICFRLADDDLITLQQKIERQYKIITDFLIKQGFKQEEISYGIPYIDDKESRPYNIDRKLRYAAELVITIRSNQVGIMEKTLQQSGQLVAKGIALDNSWDYRPKFIFTKLNDIKPTMIQEATVEARKAAEQFAKDSGSQVGNISHATQGAFTIEDTHIPIKKHVRVVTTVQYAIID